MADREPEIDILLLRPSDRKSWPSDPLLMSIGLGYLASALREEGARIETIDNHFENLDDEALLARLLSYRFPLLCVSLSHQYPNMWPLFDMLGRFKRLRPDVRIVTGGVFPSLAWKHLLSLELFDAVAVGEGEETIRELCQVVRNRSALEHVPNLVIPGESAAFHTRRTPPPDLDSLPFPERPYLARLYRESPAVVRQSWHSISRSRGCYGNCSFCAIAPLSRIDARPCWRSRRAQSVVDELCWLNRQFGVRRVRFSDDDFLGFGLEGRDAALDFAEAMIESQVAIEFMISIRVDHADPAVLRPLRKAGLRIVLLGIEAGNDEDLRLYRKGTTVERNVRAIRTALQCGLEVVPALIPFHPWSSMERVKRTLDLISRHGHDRMRLEPLNLFNRLSPLAGTAMERQFRSFGFPTNQPFERLPDERYPFLDHEVASFHETCTQYFHEHAATAESLLRKTENRLFRIQDEIGKSSYALRERFYRQVRASIQKQILDAFRQLADASDYTLEAPQIQHNLARGLGLAYRELLLSTRLDESLDSTDGERN